MPTMSAGGAAIPQRPGKLLGLLLARSFGVATCLALAILLIAQLCGAQ